jgi:hypothetical protein
VLRLHIELSIIELLYYCFLNGRALDLKKSLGCDAQGGFEDLSSASATPPMSARDSGDPTLAIGSASSIDLARRDAGDAPG